MTISCSGGSFDWVKAAAGIKSAYTLECRTDSPRPGFLLPASGIIPSGEETWAGVKYIAEFLIDKYGMKPLSMSSLMFAVAVVLPMFFDRIYGCNT